jgi:hypothetical protein
LFDVLVVDGGVAGALVDALLEGAAVEFAGEVVGDDVDPAGASFLSPVVAGAFSPSEGGFSLSE